MKSLLGLLFTVLLAVQTAHAQGELPPAPGELVDIGGYNLHLYCTGEGSPAVLMDAGLGDGSLHFRDLQERVAEFTRVCTFDRAGYGWSEAGPKPRTSQQLAGKLKTLLETARVEGPYVLVGHSFGGLNMLLFANENPDLVAGVVLIDSSHPDQRVRLAEAAPEMAAAESQEIERFRALPEAAAQGQLSAADVLPTAPAGIPEDLRETWAELFVQPRNLLAGIAEYDALDQSMAQVKDNGSLGDIPLIVIAAGLKMADVMPPEMREQMGLITEVLAAYDATWRSLQEDHLTRSSSSKLMIAENSPHYIHFTEPELVVGGIQELVGP